MARVDSYPNIDPNDQVELAAWETDADLPHGGRVVNITIPALLAYLTPILSSSINAQANIHVDPDTGTRYQMGVTIDIDTMQPTTTWTELAPIDASSSELDSFILDESELL